MGELKRKKKRGGKTLEFEIVTTVPDGKKKVIRKKLKDTSEILYLETSIDRLYKMLKENKEMKIKDIAKEFDVPPRTVEEWGRILEEHGLAEIHYPPFGEPTIKMKEIKEEK